MRRWCCTGGSAKAPNAPIVSAIGLCIGVATIAAAPRAEARDANWAIPAGPLQTALVTFAIQDNVSISTPTRGFGNRRAPHVAGVMSAEEALTRLLSGSGYTFVRVNAAAYQIVPGNATAPPRAPESSPQNEIVITARHRPEVLNDVPAAATAVTGNDLQELGVRSASDVLLAASGLSTSNIGPGRNKIFIRGLSDGAFTGRAESTVGVYYDNTRLIEAAPDPDLALIDVDAVEILRGPQGALYGGGAIAGVYRIVPRTPDLQTLGGELSGNVETSRHASISNSVAAVLNAPLVQDRAGFRVVAYRQVEAGWLDNPGLGLDNTNETRRAGGRLSLAFDARNGWTFAGALVQQYTDSEDGQYSSEQQGHARATRVLEPHDNDFRMVSLTARGPTRLGALTATTSIIHHSFDSRYDATGAFVPLGAAPNQTAVFDELQSQKFFTQEFRLTGVASPFPWTIGAFASLGDIRRIASVKADPDAPSAQSLYSSGRDDDLHQYGVFGDLSFNLTHKLTLDLGARIFRSELDVDATAQAGNAGFTDDFAGRQTQSGWAPSIQLAYRQSADAHYYALLSQGYRSGGFNTGAASLLSDAAIPQPHRRYDADRIWNAEIGADYRLFDNRWQLRFAAFHQFWEQVQTDQLVVSGLSFTGNVGDARNDGIELESSYAFSNAWRLNSQLTFVQPKIDHGAAGFPVSDELPGAPHFLLSSTLRWRRDVGLGEVQADLSALYLGRADITFSQNAMREVGGYFESDFRVSLTHDDWRAGFYIDNLTNSRSSTFSYGTPFTLGVPGIETPLRPRAVGFELRRAF